MSDVVIKVDSLGKKYRIQHRRKEGYATLRDTIMDAARRLLPVAHSDALLPASEEEFWALRNVSFEVRRGEVVGLIGRNGAGKSTLLKILSRITDPSEGRVELRGHVGSLLEVGTGFHPELSGRENIFLNGSILGMTRGEVARKFDEIVAFAEISKFLDTAVKRYSSGMYVRLAFAVAAHLNPEILIVDEVLAVGDDAFQKKCLGTIREVTKEGARTVLFVSHNMASIQHLSHRVMLLTEGRVAADGSADAVIGEYLSDAHLGTYFDLSKWKDRRTTGEATITAIEFIRSSGETSVRFGGVLRLRLHSSVHEPLVDPCFGVIIHDALGTPVLDLRSIHDGLRLGRVSGLVSVDVSVENIGLYPGSYLLSPWIMDSACVRDIDFPRLCARFEVHPTPGPHGDLKLDAVWGRYFAPSNWRPA